MSACRKSCSGMRPAVPVHQYVSGQQTLTLFHVSQLVSIVIPENEFLRAPG